MDTITPLLEAVAQARARYIAAVSGVSPAQAVFKPTPTRWSILEITEHLVRAEEAGISGMWRALDGYWRGEALWSGDPVHRGLPIEEVVAQTWQPKEQVPDVAAPRWGGSLAYWVATLRSKQGVLEDLAKALAGVALEDVIYPHPISGPLDVRQRLEFLGFHMDRHRLQVEALSGEPGYPLASSTLNANEADSF